MNILPGLGRSRKGGKMSNFEGGIRTCSFISGGVVPAARRGSKYAGLVALYDWCVRTLHYYPSIVNNP